MINGWSWSSIKIDLDFMESSFRNEYDNFNVSLRKCKIHAVWDTTLNSQQPFHKIYLHDKVAKKGINGEWEEKYLCHYAHKSLTVRRVYGCDMFEWMKEENLYFPQTIL